MHRGYQDRMLPVAKNVAVLDGIPLSPNQYLEHLAAGFEAFYRFLIQKRQALLASPVFAVLQGQPVRFLFRTTNVYSVVLQKALAPEFLQDGVDRSIELDILARGFLTSPNKPSNWSIFHAELSALEKSDIPHFITNSNSIVLDIGSDRPAIAGYFAAPSFTQVIDQLQRWDKLDLAEQINLIRASFSAKVARSPEAFSAISRTTDYSNNHPPTRFLYTQLAWTQSYVVSSAIRSKRGASRRQVQPVP
jgi:lantibiotic modifying enzyme